MGKKITIILFLIFIYGFFTFTLIKEDDSLSETENRTLAQKPELSVESFFKGDFTSQYEAYVQDQFPSRDGFVSMKNYMELVVGKTMVKDIYLGKDGYLIENHKKSDYYSDRAMKNSDAIITAGNRWAKALGNDHVSVMVVPTAQTILQNKLPLFATPYDQMDYINPIKNGLPEGVFVDISQELKNHNDEYIYYKTDHHWTTYGAYIAYSKWCQDKGLSENSQEDFLIETVTDEFLGTIDSKLNIETQADTIEIYSLRDYNMKVVYNMGAKTSDSLFDYTYLNGKDKYSLFMGGNQGIVEITGEHMESLSDKNPEDVSEMTADEKSLLILKDSYANSFASMTAGMYDRVYVVDLRYFNMNIDTFIEMYNITDVLFLYNADTLTDDVYVSRIG